MIHSPIRRAPVVVAFLALLLLFSFGPTGAAGTASAATAPESLRVMTWNICGEAGGATPLDQGYCPYRNDPQHKADTISQAVAQKHINALLLQEVCFDAAQHDSHLDLLAQQLHAASPLWEFAWTPMERPGGRTDCRGTLHGTLGIAVAVKGHITEQVATELAPWTADSAQSKLLCVRVDGWRSRVCGLHMPAKKADLSAEVSKVLTVIAGDSDVVVGGDFNSSYPASSTGNLKPLYARFSECDATSYASGDAANEPTHFTPKPTGANGVVTSMTYDPGKLDYIFGTAGFTQCDSWTQLADQANYASTTQPAGISDHAPLYGTTAGRAVPMPPALQTTVPAATGPADPGCGSNGPYGTVNTLRPRLQARVSDTDDQKQVAGQFSIWDDTDPSQPQPIVLGDANSTSALVTGDGTVSVPMPSALLPGHLYGWRTRTIDSSGTTSAITANCHFRVAANAS
ncbi:endonuclease/exonuclease/phosphatase family protein [Streptomyces sp. NPDC092296]|uniref:endonuclease/exonuclease/phosphatase family protein n=1 Tax=Streptomyces sp. NPDC092296 TaxID=3366012 RepID=UPI003822700D